MTKAIAKASLADYAAVINDAHRAAFQSAQTAIEHARVAGEHLIKAKAALNHGEWLPWLAANVEVTERQAQRYVKLAENWTAISAKYDAASYLTIDGALASLAKPKLEAPQSVVTRDLPEPVATSAPKPVAPVEVEKLKADNSALVERLAEMSTQQSEMQDELLFLQKIEESGDKLKAALDEVKKLQALVRVLEERNRGMLNAEAEAKRAAKMWRTKHDALERKLKGACV